MRLTPLQLEATLRLKENPDFGHFMQAIGNYAGELTENLIYAPPEKTDALQGMTRGVVEVIKAVDKARPAPPPT